ncbi:DUF6538 domain-containing protein [Bradyrhizobium sp. USDA 326]|uniref:DUF6538 domain-containing protein n=1 Tax=Bradyrhizobium sp. USDA 326 TaxID=3377726 RepID=UPI003C70FA22
MDRKYLVKQYNTYSVVVEVPKALQAKAGRKRFKKSLGTDSLAEANKRKHFHVANFHRQIAELAKGSSDSDVKLARMAGEFWQALESSDKRWHEDDQEREWSEYEEELDRLKAQATEILNRDGSEAAARFYKAATGQATFLKDQYPLWLAEVQHAGQTKVQHESAIKRFMGWATDSVTIEEVSRREGRSLRHRPADRLRLRTCHGKAARFIPLLALALARGTWRCAGEPLARPATRKEAGAR